jgi:hypothetical protein
VKTPFEVIVKNFNSLKPLEEKLKEQINLLLANDNNSNEINEEIKSILQKYTSVEWVYFFGTSYMDDNLNILYSAIHNYSLLLSKKYLNLKRVLVNYQEEIYKSNLQFSSTKQVQSI